MASERYSEFAKDRGFPATTASTQGDEGKPSKTVGNVYGDTGPKDFPMNTGTKRFGDPGGFKTQPRDRSWGMRQADGLAQCKGLGGPGEDYEEETFVKR